MKRNVLKFVSLGLIIVLTIALILPLAASTSMAAGTLPQDYKGFYVSGRNLYDGNHNIFKPIGVNSLFMYQDRSGAKTIPEVAKSKANCIRMFWKNDPNTPLSQLETAIKSAIANKLVIIAGMWDATSDFSKIDICVNYWLRTDVVQMVKKYENYFILNIANEAGDGTEAKPDWQAKYIEIVGKLRDAGYRVPLMIDASKSGRDETYFFECGQNIVAADPLKNIIFDWHAWDSLQPRSRYTNAFENMLTLDLCIVVGEFSHLNTSYNRNVNWVELVEEANKYEVGWLPWSWYLSGDLHNVSSNWTFEAPTTWGALILDEIAKQGKTASVFNGIISATPTASPNASPTSSAVAVPTPNPTVSASPTADTTKPVISILPYSKRWTNKNVVIHATTNEGVLNTSSHTFSKNGSFTFIATDEAGNFSIKKLSVTNIDKILPRITARQLNGKIISEGAIVSGKVAVSIVEPNLLSKTSRFNGKLFKWPSSNTFMVLGKFTLTVKDKAGNSSVFKFQIN